MANPVENSFTVRLRKISGELICVIPKALENDRDIMDARLGITEDEGRGGVLDLDQSDQAAVLVHARNDIVDVLGIGHMDVVGTQAQEIGFPDELIGSEND